MENVKDRQTYKQTEVSTDSQTNEKKEWQTGKQEKEPLKILTDKLTEKKDRKRQTETDRNIDRQR